ncbi:RING finger protein 151-like [Mizuhopecten yessoensis]|uniref:E3 ubiquitin-protein ligase NRDP1 n=1 Tax=Mizuhopecten yessoensis TaxID=6573 RepID=A0A210PXW2_MIZYE|nr:RING finger protein 151-like [Mizuhopecten yessoensis]XP_021372381.1 RING finger protein 151-like [Mizuhopecten yessoensis]XP_021372382.1 RING finger protein 151-like [Mizuhopecten yessoensis]XP_021372383.1 RING finger protein 151-like [Mizuhopecten yessoensis]OWF41314.1 E3 ubiquitin-protein ligase NRDP1 [Mizuhopecten yessoensis]
MGYDVDRFVVQVNDGLLCCICRDVLEDPVQAPCEHAFCRTCIEGWLVENTRCPEDRKPLSLSALKSLFRYMRNDLNKLQLKCCNHFLGCTHVGDLEFMHTHESDCPLGTVACPNDKCNLMVTRKDLIDHLETCEFRSKECPTGCGMLIVSPEHDDHNCIAELRTAYDVLRSEMTCKIQEQRHEMELRLNMQREHMVQKESTIQCQVDELKSELSRMTQKMKLLMDLEIQRRQDTEKLELEKKELMELLKGQALDGGASRGQQAGSSRTHFPPSLKGKVTTI